MKITKSNVKCKKKHNNFEIAITNKKPKKPLFFFVFCFCFVLTTSWIESSCSLTNWIDQ